MSQHTHALNPGHGPFEPAPTRQSASGPKDRIASSRDIAIYFREDCRGLRDSLQLEMVVAQYYLRIAGVQTTDGVPAGNAVGPSVVAELEHEGDELSHAILRGLAHLGAGAMAKRSVVAARHLVERGIGLPQQFADVGEARATGAWRYAGEVDAECVLLAEFEHPSGPRHAVAMYVEPRGLGIVKHLGLIGPVTEFDPDDPFHPSALEELDIPAAGALMRDVLERGRERPVVRDDFRALIAAARARSMLPAVEADVQG